MAFSNAASRAKYFESLKASGKLNPGIKSPLLGQPPAQHMNQIAASPLTPPVMPPKMAQPIQAMPAMKANVPPNPMKPLNPAGANKFGKLKKFF